MGVGAMAPAPRSGLINKFSSTSSKHVDVVLGNRLIVVFMGEIIFCAGNSPVGSYLFGYIAAGAGVFVTVFTGFLQSLKDRYDGIGNVTKVFNLLGLCHC